MLQTPATPPLATKAAGPPARATPAALLRRAVPLIMLLALVAGLGLLAMAGTPVLQRRVILALIYLIAVVGLYVFVGNSGVLAFSSAGFMAIGAYTSALLTMRPAVKATFLPDLPALLAAAHLSPWAGALAGGAMTALIAFLIAIPLMRLSGISAGIATFSVMVICYIVLGNWTSLTGGQQSLMGLPGYVDLKVALGVALVTIIIAFVYQETRWALALRASREDEVAARAAGVRIHRLRVGAFTLSAFITGLAGVLFGHFLGTLRIENFYLDLTFLLMAMLVVGGIRSLTGAVIGTVAISALTELFRQIEIGIALPGTGWTLSAPPGLGDVALALTMLLIILFRPAGIAGGRELSWPFRRPRR